MIGGTLCGDDKEYTVLGVSIRRISDFRTVSDEAVLVFAKTILADEMRRILSPTPPRVSGTNSNYKSRGTKNFHAEMAVTMVEQFKGKIEISPRACCNPLDVEQIYRAKLLRDPIPNWP